MEVDPAAELAVLANLGRPASTRLVHLVVAHPREVDAVAFEARIDLSVDVEHPKGSASALVERNLRGLALVEGVPVPELRLDDAPRPEERLGLSIGPFVSVREEFPDLAARSACQMRGIDDVRQWARREFAAARLGDRRRVRRLVMMAEQVALAPAGLISDVFDSDATRQAAYDFLESPFVQQPPMQRALADACARAAAPQPFAFVAIDGTTLTLTDVNGTKDFGNIGGGSSVRARGVKVISALGLEPSGVPLGIAAQRYWARPDKESRSRREQKREVRERDGCSRRRNTGWTPSRRSADASTRGAPTLGL